jgi:hypothetical protein
MRPSNAKRSSTTAPFGSGAGYIHVAGDHFQLPNLSVLKWAWPAVGVAILIAVLALGVGQNPVHPQVTRQQAIQAALRYGVEPSYRRVQAKYMRYSDLAKGNPGDFMRGADDRDYFIWVVAVSGHYGISPLGTTSWGIAVIRDQPSSADPAIFEGGIQGNWPPFFDNLPDLTQ